jgi:hypothetical protein
LLPVLPVLSLAGLSPVSVLPTCMAIFWPASNRSPLLGRSMTHLPSCGKLPPPCSCSMPATPCLSF